MPLILLETWNERYNVSLFRSRFRAILPSNLLTSHGSIVWWLGGVLAVPTCVRGCVGASGSNVQVLETHRGDTHNDHPGVSWIRPPNTLYDVCCSGARMVLLARFAAAPGPERSEKSRKLTSLAESMEFQFPTLWWHTKVFLQRVGSC